MKSLSSIRLTSLAQFIAPAFVLIATACSSAPQEDSASGTAQALSSTVHTDYGITTFGGPGDYQVLACGGNSRTTQEWYVASSQRYGCHVHLQLTTSDGKCLVVQTEDAGPASYVESRAGIAVLDSSPAVAKYLFNNSSGLGYDDLAAHPGVYDVHAVVTNAALGPCASTTSNGDDSSASAPSASASPKASAPVTATPDAGASSGSTGGTGTGTGTGTTADAGSSSSGDDDDDSNDGTPCNSDGDCNPGGNGAGQICVSNVCVDGCDADWECPGNTSCTDGSCQ